MKKVLEVITLNKEKITDFARERNALLAKSKADFIFFVDSDEVVSRALKIEILKRIQEDEAEGVSGYWLTRDNYFLGRLSGTDKILRVARKGAGQWQRMVHEVWRVKGKTGILKNHLRHNTAGSVRFMIDKINRYSTLHAIANLKEGKKSDIFKIIFMPKLKFVQSVFVGKGVALSILMAFHSFLSWSKEWQLQKD